MTVYEKTVEKLHDFGSWDVQGLIADVSKRLKDDGDEEASAVIDSLILTIQDIDRLIRSGRIISASTIGSAARISQRYFCAVDTRDVKSVLERKASHE